MNALALAGAGVSVQCDWIDTKKGASMKVWIKAGDILCFGILFFEKTYAEGYSQII